MIKLFKVTAIIGCLVLLIGCTKNKDDKIEKTEISSDDSCEVTNTTEKEDFILSLNSDKAVYLTKENISLTGTLEYVGNEDSIKVWHSAPIVSYTIKGIDNDFQLLPVFIEISTYSILNKGTTYEYPFKKSGEITYSDKKFDTEKFLAKQDLYLPVGTYDITFSTNFYLDEEITQSVDYDCSIQIKVDDET